MTAPKDEVSVEKCIEELENYLDIDEEMAEAAIAHLRSLQQMRAEIAAKDKILDQHIAALRSVAWAITDKACGGFDDIVAEAKRVRAELEACRKDAERYRWLDKNISYYNTCDADRPALHNVSRRIWYHASDNSNDRTLAATIDAAISAGEDSGDDTFRK